MTREAIQIETTRQLRLLNRKKGKPSDGTGPGNWTELADKGCRVRLWKRRAEERLEAILRSTTALRGERAGEILRASDDRVSYGWYL